MARAPTDIRSKARAHTDTALRVLSSIMTMETAPAAARAQAAQYLLDRGWGKAEQHIDQTVRTAGPAEHTPDLAGIRDRAVQSVQKTPEDEHPTTH